MKSMGFEPLVAAANAWDTIADSAPSHNNAPRDKRRQSALGAPHIHGELLKLGFAVAQSTVAKYMAKKGDPSGQGWGTFLRNHMPHIAPMDLFVVPTIDFIQLYVLVIGRLARRELAWINVTAHPTPEWIAQQVTDAFPWNQVPRYLIRDRDGIYGAAVPRRLRAMGLRDKPIAPGSPWQNGYVERLIGTTDGNVSTTTLSYLGRRTCAGSLGSMPSIIMNRGFIGRWTRMPRSIGRLSASVPSHHSLSLAVFIINIVESDFRYTQVPVFSHIWPELRREELSEFIQLPSKLINWKRVLRFSSAAAYVLPQAGPLGPRRASNPSSTMRRIVIAGCCWAPDRTIAAATFCRKHAKSARTLGPRKKAGSTSGRIDIEQLTLRVRIFENGRHHQIGIVIIGHQGRGGVSPCSLDVRDHVCGAIRHLERAECAGARRHVSYPRIGLQEPRALRELLAKVPPSLHAQSKLRQEICAIGKMRRHNETGRDVVVVAGDRT
jgi:transposase InsO family protein